MSTDNKSRENWIDNIKGIGILFVMYGHVLVTNNGFCSWITMFHVQLFLILSGFLYATKGTEITDIKKKACRTGVIYLRFSIVAIIANMIWNYLHGSGVVKYFVFDSYKTISLYGVFALWYLTSYIIASAIFLFAISKFKNGMLLGLFVLLCVALSIGVYYLLNSLSNVVGTALYAIISFPTVAVFRSIAAVLYIYVGWCIRKSNIFEKLNSTILAGLGGCLMIISCAFSRMAPNRNFSTLTFGDRAIVYLIGSLLGAVGVILLFYGIKGAIPFINFLGKNSLIILVTHMSFRMHNIAQTLCSRFLPEDRFLFGIVCLLILIIMEMPVIYLLQGPLKQSLEIPNWLSGRLNSQK